MLDRGRIRQLRRQIERARSEGDLDVVQGLIDELASIVNALRISAARKDPNRFIEYAFQDKHGRALHQAAFHQRWQESIYHSHFSPQGHKRLMVVAPRDHGKCVPDDGLVTLHDGQRVRAVDLPDRFDALTWSEEQGFHVEHARKWRQRIQEVWELETVFGRKLRVSREHPLRTPYGWMPICNVQPGQHVATARCSETALRLTSEDVDRAWLLGVLLGDGGLTQPSRVTLTSSNDSLVAEAARVCGLNGWRLRNKTPREPGNEWSLSGRSLLAWLRGLRVHGCDSYSKRIPMQCFSWDARAIASLASGFLETDGSVSDGAAGRLVEFFSVSLPLLQDLQSLLLRLGVQSILAPKRGVYKGAPHWSWRLTVCGSSMDALALLADARGPKVRKLLAMRKRRASDSRDLIPDALIDRIPGRFKRNPPRLDTRRIRGHQRWKALARVPSGPLAQDFGLSWEEVSAVRCVGKERTWSIEVQGSHVHLVGDFITHNTTQVIGRALWELGDNPNLRLKIACQSDSKAMERLFEITDNLERNEAVKRVFPNMVPACRGDWTKHKIVVDRKLFSKDASVEALGILSTATGGRCDMLIADDIVDRRNALQYPQIRETIKHAWKSDWTNLLEPDGRVIYICTLWHTADLSHELLENPAFAVLRYDVLPTMDKIQASVALPFTGNGRRERKSWIEPLWNHWTKEALVMRRDEIGQAEFDRAFRNIALSGEIAVIDLSLIQYLDDLPKDLIFVQGYDLAIGTKQHHNFFACATVAVSPSEGMLYTVDAWHAKLSFTRQAAAVIEGYFGYEPAEQYMETGSYADSLPQYLDSIVGKLIDEDGQVHDKRDGPPEGLRAVPLLPIVARKPIVDKMTRLKRITPYLERGQHKFLSKLDPTKNDALRDRGDLVGELTTFPLGRDDDILDAWVMAMSGACNLFAREQDDGDDGPELDLCVRVLGG